MPLAWLAKHGRISLETLRRFYVRHEIPNDPFECNAKFALFGSDAVERLCCAWDAQGAVTAIADAELLLQRIGLTRQKALSMGKAALFAAVAPLVVEDAPRFTGAANLLVTAAARVPYTRALHRIEPLDVVEDDTGPECLLHALGTGMAGDKGTEYLDALVQQAHAHALEHAMRLHQTVQPSSVARALLGPQPTVPGV